jgi:putative spermidine/putrescine transport system substrate-binding protein
MPPNGNGVPMRTVIGRAEKWLNLVVWRRSTEPAIVRPFEAQTGCDVRATDARTPDRLVTLMLSGRFDGALASGAASNRLISAGAAAPIDTKLIPDFGDISPKLQSPPHNTVNGVHYGVSYQWAANLLMYNTQVVKPAPTSWSLVFDGSSYTGGVTAFDSPMSIADAALYLKSAQPSLGIGDPYELNRQQFDAAVALVRKQRAQIGSYWSSVQSEIQEFKDGGLVIGQSWPGQVNALKLDGQPVDAVAPREGMTGWADSWMVYAKARHPSCMLRWLRYVTTPVVQGMTAYAFGSAPANPKACTVIDSVRAGYCSDYHVTDPSYVSNVDFWQTPQADCGNGKPGCVPYARWAEAWEAITG